MWGFVCAFLVAGTICLVGQLISELFDKYDAPTYLMIVVVVGALLMASGLATGIQAISEAGLAATILNVGVGMCQFTQLLLVGVPQPFFLMWGVYVCMTIVGILTGIICVKMKGIKPQAESESGSESAR